MKAIHSFPQLTPPTLSTVRNVHNVPHRLDVLLWHKSRKPLLRPRLLAETGNYTQDSVRERRDQGGVGEVED